MRVALIVDVDGVVSPVHGKTGWGDDVTGGPGLGYLPVSPALNHRLDVLADRADVTAAWLTSWDAEMRRGMRFPGAKWTTVAHHDAGSGPPTYDEEAARLRAGERWRDITWWKWWAIDAWLDEHPEVDTVVWCDDDLGRALFDFCDADDVDDGWALTRGMFASVELERRGLNALLLAPATDVGLTPAHFDQVESFVGDRAVRTQIRMPRDLQPPSSMDTLVSFVGRQSRRCAACEPTAWYLRHAPFVVDCTTCGRSSYGPYDITADISPPPPTATPR